MPSLRHILLGLLIVILWPGVCSAQRFVPRPRPPVRPPSPAPRIIPGPIVHPAPRTPNAGGGAAQAEPAQEKDEGNTWVGWLLVGGVGALGLIGFVCWVCSRSPKRSYYVRVHSAPPGEAPEHIRRAWVGMLLPLLPGASRPKDLEQVEVISLQVVPGEAAYVVDGERALQLLAEHDLRAADWWRENCAAPLDAGGCFAFPPDVCEVVEGRQGSQEVPLASR